MVLWFHVKYQKNGKGKNPLETLNSAYQATSDPFWIDLRCKEKKPKKSVCPAPEGHPAIIPWVILADTGDQNISIFLENHRWGQNYYIWDILHREYRYRLKGC